MDAATRRGGGSVSGRGRRYPRKALVGALVALFALAGTAGAVRLRGGDILIIGDGGFTPKALPRTHDAPIDIHLHGRIETVSGVLPPALKEIMFEFDRHGHLDSTGLAVCSIARLEATTVPKARKLCPGAIVGTGFGRAIVKFPEQAAIPVSSPITIFNGPKKDGDFTVLAHGYTTIPVPTTIVVPIVIEKVNHGVYGYRTVGRIPELAGGYGIPISASLTVGREWIHNGDRHSYLNARCETGRLQARGEFIFRDGTLIKGTFLKPCKVRPESRGIGPRPRHPSRGL